MHRNAKKEKKHKQDSPRQNRNYQLHLPSQCPFSSYVFAVVPPHHKLHLEQLSVPADRRNGSSNAMRQKMAERCTGRGKLFSQGGLDPYCPNDHGSHKRTQRRTASLGQLAQSSVRLLESRLTTFKGSLSKEYWVIRSTMGELLMLSHSRFISSSYPTFCSSCI